MSNDADQLVDALVADLEPVEPLPPLRRAAIWILAAVTASTTCVFCYQFLTGVQLLKPNLANADLMGIAAHLTLAGGALAVALASSVPGREPVERAGLVAVGIGTIVTLAAVYAGSSLPESAYGTSWWRMTTYCLSVAAIPALVPAALLTQFALRGAPFRPLRTLAFGALSAVAFATLPGHLSCPGGGPGHSLIAHHLAPVFGGVLILGVTASLWPRQRAS